MMPLYKPYTHGMDVIPLPIQNLKTGPIQLIIGKKEGRKKSPTIMSIYRLELVCLAFFFK